MTQVRCPQGYGAEQRWWAFATLAVAVFISVLDLFIVNIAFSSIERQWPGAGLASLSWVLSGYGIALAALLVPLGRLGDLLGRKRVFQAGLGIFVAASALCAAAPSPEFLVAARVLQGVGAAALTPTSLSLLLPLFAARERPTVIGAWAALGGVGAAMGPPLGGLLVQASWRWIFLVNVPLGVLTLWRVQRNFGEVRDRDAQMPDLVGSVLLAGAVAFLTLGLVEGPDWAWDGRVVASLLAALAAGVAFVARSRRHASPVLDLKLFRAPSFSYAVVSTLLFFAGFAALLLSGVLFLTHVWQYSVLHAGLALAPGPVMAALFAAPGGRLVTRYGPGSIGFLGGLLFAAGAMLLAGLPGRPDYLHSYLPAMLIGGAGVGLILPTFTSAAVLAVPPARLTTGIAAETTFRQIGAALAVAAWVAIYGTPRPDEVLRAFHRGYLYTAACSLAAAVTLLALALTTRRPRRSIDASDATPEPPASVRHVSPPLTRSADS
jgi:EmrB/QacA subfamily drug resistance transporter